MKLTDDIYVYEWTNYFDNNCNSFYIGGGINALVDPGLTRYLPNLLERMADDGIKREDIAYVINTHSHPDHFQASEMFDPEEVKIALHPQELQFLKGVGGDLYELFGISAPQVQITFPLEEGDVAVGDHIFKCILAPGHSPGSIGLYWPERKALFCGDVIFAQNVGRTDFPGGSSALLKKSIISFAQLDIEFLLPGHMGIIAGKDKIRKNFEIIIQHILPYI
ncbi:MAG TPA: MBL fold metallo-hydrolase [Smithellaceae bacterium]|nr:MBL fold metallo-hydrolase [Smithellaceae bacterium]